MSFLQVTKPSRTWKGIPSSLLRGPGQARPGLREGSLWGNFTGLIEAEQSARTRWNRQSSSLA